MSGPDIVRDGGWNNKDAMLDCHSTRAGQDEMRDMQGGLQECPRPEPSTSSNVNQILHATGRGSGVNIANDSTAGKTCWTVSEDKDDARMDDQPPLMH